MKRSAEFARIAERLLSTPLVIDALQAIDSAVTAPGAAQLALAAEHAWLQPIADAFAGDPPDYHKWLLHVRDERKLSPTAEDKTEVRHHVRTVYQRHMMRARRHRLCLARTILELEKGRMFEGPARAKLEASLVRAWIAQRDAWVSSVAGNKPLSYDERVELYGQFWASLDTKLEARLEHAKAAAK